MAGNIFINYRRDESGHVAGRLHDSLAPTFGRDKLFMDVDNIPVGRDFEDYLKRQVAACDAMLAIIGPNWLIAKDEAGQRRLDNPEDFIVIEIGAALARDIPVVPVLVDGARMPKASELPDSLKLLARRQAVQVRHTNFSSDAETLVRRLREALGYESPGRKWHVRAIIAVTAVVLLLIGVGGYATFQHLVEQGPAEAEAKRKMDQGVAYAKKGNFDRAITEYNEAIRLDPKNAGAFFSRGVAYAEKGDRDLAIADYSEVIRLNPKNAVAFANRGADYFKKGDFDRAVADSSEAIRLNPERFAWVYCIRGTAKLKKNDSSGNADIAKARQLDPSTCR
jgi:tetratricopeptide (TPR) repeat protein